MGWWLGGGGVEINKLLKFLLNRSVILEGFNPFAATACKISGLKDARTRLRTVYFPVL